MFAGRDGGGIGGGRCGGSGIGSGLLGGGAGGKLSLNKSRPLLLYSVLRPASNLHRCSSGFSTGSGAYAVSSTVLPGNGRPLLSRYKTPAAIRISATSKAAFVFRPIMPLARTF